MLTYVFYTVKVEMQVDNYSCIPATRVIPSGCCEMCHWDSQDEQWSCTQMMLKYRSKRNKVLDCIDQHRSLHCVPHLAALGQLHDVYYVCRQCFFLLRQTGRRHYREHSYQPQP